MSSEEQDRIEAMLREPADRLPPPDGAWTRVRRRAWRRKWAKAGIVVAAGLVITAGAVPAALAVRHTSNDQTLQVTNTPTPGLGHHSTLFRPAPPSPSSTPTTARNGQPLAGFTPISVSFVSQTVGWVWGSAGPAGPGVIAATTDGGHTWVRRPAPPVTATDVAGSGDSGIRYANGQVGYVFGADTFMTLDAGLHWQRIRRPGRVVDLEAMNGRVWPR